MLLKYVYVAFIGVLVALFIGVGIAAFYPAPQNPNNYIVPSKIDYDLATQSAQLQEENIRQQAEWKEFDLKNQHYSKNVAIMTIVAAVILLGISLLMAKTLLVIADGLLVGGLLTLIYSLIRSFGTQDYKFMFVAITIVLAITITLGYLKLIKPAKK